MRLGEGLRGLILVAVLTGLASAAGTGRGHAAFDPLVEDVPPLVPGRESPPPLSVPPPDPCEAAVTETDGIVTLRLDDRGRAGTALTVTLDDVAYAARFDANGGLDVQAPLFHASAALFWPGRDGKTCARRGVTFSRYGEAFLIAAVWSGQDVDLGLHVVEPRGGRFGGARGYVFPGRPNLDGATGLGRLRIFGEAVPGGTRVALYALPADRNPHEGDVSAFFELVSRGNPARLPFCGADPSVTVAAFKAVSVAAGATQARNLAFNAVPCGYSWPADQPESGYFIARKWSLKPRP